MYAGQAGHVHTLFNLPVVSFIMAVRALPGHDLPGQTPVLGALFPVMPFIVFVGTNVPFCVLFLVKPGMGPVMPDEIGIYAPLRITAVAAIPRAIDPLGRDPGVRIFLNVLSYFPKVNRDFMERISFDP